ncbi:MAG: threonylcarbamoyladenosine tRNA methylthiotransferase MtaB, partial [Hyphomonas sp.]
LRAARPDMAFGADLIAGFPTETEAHFENSLRLVEECGISFLHAFPYSPRPGTPAARMPQLDKVTIKARAARLRAAGEKALVAHLARHVGSHVEALVERDASARLPDFTPVRLEGNLPSAGRVTRTHITGHNGTHLIGTLA